MCVVASTVMGINLVVKKIMLLLSAIEMDTGSQALMISVLNPQINLVSSHISEASLQRGSTI